MSARIKTRLQELLSQEKGAVVREWGASWPIALVYPQIYPVAMGNLGFQAIYHLLNTDPRPGVRAGLPAHPRGVAGAPAHPYPGPYPGVPAAPYRFRRGGLFHLL